MSGVEFDHAVVGAGIVGVWTALHLLKKGGKVLLLEQFGPAHTRGSSQGCSRLIRSAYSEPCFAEMMPQAFRMWEEAERETDTKLIEKASGLLCVANDDESMKSLEKMIANMRNHCPDNLSLDDPLYKELISSLLCYPEAKGVLMDKSGGILLAHKSLLAIQALFRKKGGVFWENCPVRRLEPVNEQEVRLHVDCAKVVTVRSVVVCAGSWTKELLSPFVSLPLQCVTVWVYYWKVKWEEAYSQKSGFPAFLDLCSPYILALPSYEYPGMIKVVLHGGTPSNPDERDKVQQDPVKFECLKNYVKEHWPHLDDEPSIIEKCMYTVTPDETYLIDTVSHHKNIVYGSACSGTGFKTSPVVGRILSEMARGEQPFLDITPYRLSRFGP